jgi:hypothetical protein
LYALFGCVVHEQNALIALVYEFMKEAAVIFKLTRPLRLDAHKVLSLARTLDQSISRQALDAYIKETVRYYLTLADPVNDRCLNSYVALAKRMRGDQRATELINALCKGFANSEMCKAFFAMCVPSGTGKTQLAFTLPEDCRVVYMNMSLEKAVDTDLHQAIYRNFSSYMEFILEKLLREDSASKSTELWVYGFVNALMGLLQQNPGLDLPADLSRVSSRVVYLARLSRFFL